MPSDLIPGGGYGSREENASNQESRAPFRFHRNGKGSGLYKNVSANPGLLTAGEAEPASPAARHQSGNVELTFLGYPFESFGRVLDPILAVVAVGRKQPEHLVGAAGGRTRDIAGSKIDGLSNGEFVFQRAFSIRKTQAMPTVPLASADRKPGGYIAWRRCFWPVTSGHSKRADLAGISV
jgi:hypothetical protein